MRTNSLGRYMLIAAFALLLLLLTWFMQDRLDAMYNPNPSPQAVTFDNSRGVTLQRNRYGHYVASGLINGQPVVFLLDTGATSVSIPESVAARLHLRKGAQQRVETANGTVQVFSTRLDNVQLGPIRLNDVRGSINPHMEGDEILLGMSFLKHLDWQQRGSQLTLFPRQR